MRRNPGTAMHSSRLWPQAIPYSPKCRVEVFSETRRLRLREVIHESRQATKIGQHVRVGV